MDEMTVRTQLAELRAALTRNKEEHAILTKLVEGFEGWLRLSLSPIGDTQPHLPLVVVPRRSTSATAKPDRTGGARGLVLEVLREAAGKPLHCRDIAAEAAAKGAALNPKDPEGWADLFGYSLKRSGFPVEKVAARTWRWTGEAGGQETQGGAAET